MKRIFFILCNIWLSIACDAQKIHFSDSTNVWQEFVVTSTGGPPEFYYYNINVIRDSILGSVDYRVLNIGFMIREDTIIILMPETHLLLILIHPYHINMWLMA